ncbi:peptidoglycan D,D-transpeptidase FtsI family protein [Streptomyces sp. H27-D2]|uniref:peptidoglycan D,D-transpeptidase FtsI family protein n=1 Tax=Streptomyces sp. H27-D2 TaxID=3046304 RepID=UPI002DB9E74A|nr:penicillin-binding transpeptidase domain-containing protein [Streptomyces sp. H27-D2]MEC4016778.1 penicillin-binding transpeptidase domain-containing protein [Streptomyces sp. H27-D2]
MIRYIRRAAAFCLLLLIALLLNASRIQIFKAQDYEDNPANRRKTIARYDQPRGNLLVDGKPVTGSRDTGEGLRYERTYPHGPLYAPVTGYASQTYGTTLLENAEDDVLSGTDPLLAPFPFWNEITREQQPGGDVRTTIKAAVQQAAYGGLGGKKGAVAAIEPKTGKILALASTPSYDPERLSGTGSAVGDAWTNLNASKSQPMLNRALKQTYPPGSTFKVVTAAAALDNGEVSDIDAPTDSPAPYTLPDTRTQLPNEASGCKNATLRYAFQVSCNTVFAKLGNDVGLDGMVGASEGFGFNDDDLTVPSRVVKSNFDTEMNASQVALSSIGQFDTTATPLQMAMVSAAVANGGEVKKPYLVDKITDSGGDTVSTTGDRTLHRAMESDTASKLQQMMVGVVTKGTGTNAAIPGAEVGGKTGTAQHGVDNKGTPYAWFLSWARADGADDPAVAVAVVVEDASANRADISGGGSAAPIARAVMRAALGG